MNYITISSDIELYVDDIIKNLYKFNNDDLKEMKEEVEEQLLKNNGIKNSEIPVFNIKTLEDVYKVKILKKLFDKYSWEELEKLNIK